MTVFDFRFYGEPVAQGRPIFNRATGFARDPEKSREYKTALRTYAQKYLQEHGGKPLEGPLTLNLIVYRSIPKSWSKKKQEQAVTGKIRPISKPDVSNYLKGIEDALSSVLMHDDSQIVSVVASKWYSSEPGIYVLLSEMECENGKSVSET